AELIELDPLIFNVISNKRVVSPLHIGLNSAGQIRLYNSSDGQGNILTISINSAYTISDFQITFGSAVADALILADGFIEHDGPLTADTTLTFNGLNISEFSIQNIGTAQIYILDIIITYSLK
ncbi:MAG: hypothetical protein PHW21_04960, partial [Candidatus Izemoplasmatales bacterium]|nr:hypothetical protein [Candidatus Izemoplasmatales bacterium]